MTSRQFPFLEKKHDGGEWRVTSPFGQRRLNGKDQFHNGIDIGTYAFTKVFAPFDGIVTDIRYSASGGNMVFVKRDNGDVTGRTIQSMEDQAKSSGIQLWGASYIGVLERGRKLGGLPKDIIERLREWARAKGISFSSPGR